MTGPALSPGGERIAMSATESGNLDIWVHDLVRSTKTRPTFDEGSEGTPIWSPSGGEIAYSLGSAGEARLMRKTADGTGEAVVLVEADGTPSPSDWSTDGRYLAYSQISLEASRDIRYVELQSDGEVSEPVTFLATPASEGALRFRQTDASWHTIPPNREACKSMCVHSPMAPVSGRCR